AYNAATTAGVLDNITIMTQDPYGNGAMTDTGVQQRGIPISQAGLPADYKFTASDAGVHTFAVTLKTAGAQTVFFQDAQDGLSGRSEERRVGEECSKRWASGLSSGTTAGNGKSLTVRALT